MQLRPRIKSLEKIFIRASGTFSIEYNILEKKIEIFKAYKEK